MNFNNEEFEIRRLNNKDVLILQKLIWLFQEVFEMENPKEANKSYLETLLEKLDFIAYVVIYNNEIIGGLTGYELPMYYSAYSEFFIYDIAIKPEFQRKGLGKKLVLSIEKYCKQKGIKEMFVQASGEDQYAIDFYHSTGGKPEKVVHFNYSLGN